VNSAVTIQLFCKHPILAQLCANNATYINSQNAKFQLNTLKQTIVSYSGLCEVTPKHFSFRFLLITSDTKDLKLKCFVVTSQKLL